MAKIALGVSSSISIYKGCEVLRGFQKAGHQVQVIMTRNAAELVTPLLFSSLAGRKAIVESFAEWTSDEIAHIALAKEVSLLCVAPATANVLAKFAGGVADDFLSTLYLAVQCPVLVAPAMNQAMYLHPQTQANIRALKARGVDFVEPGRGYLACGDEGWGRLAEAEDIVQAGLGLIGLTQSLKGKTVIVSAGPTREPLDPVRFLSNRSSGKMGFALAAEAALRGARTILVAGPTALPPLPGVEQVDVQTAREMEAEILKRFDQADIMIMAAAVSDFRFKAETPRKIKKADMPGALDLVRNPDILAGLGGRKGNKFLVGFAAETEDVIAHARTKLKEKRCDLIVANDVSRAGEGFDADQNSATLIDGREEVSLERMSKRQLGRRIWDRIEVLLGKKA
jgi:phosphopantothenoylcysteine decarboxylase / phosphopantothenate---cysteine ligase